MRVTYRELIDFLKTIPDERLDDHISILLPSTGEFCEVESITIARETNTDVLDDGHVYLELNVDP